MVEANDSQCLRYDGPTSRCFERPSQRIHRYVICHLLQCPCSYHVELVIHRAQTETNHHRSQSKEQHSTTSSRSLSPSIFTNVPSCSNKHQLSPLRIKNLPPKATRPLQMPKTTLIYTTYVSPRAAMAVSTNSMVAERVLLDWVT